MNRAEFDFAVDVSDIVDSESDDADGNHGEQDDRGPLINFDTSLESSESCVEHVQLEEDEEYTFLVANLPQNKRKQNYDKLELG